MIQPAVYVTQALEQTEADVLKILPLFLIALAIFQLWMTSPNAQLNLKIWCARNLELIQNIQKDLNIIHSFRTLVNQ